MNTRKSRYTLAFLALLLFVGTLLPMTASADVVYQTFTKDSNGDLIWTQPAYYPVAIVGANILVPDKDDPEKLNPSPMQNPKDIFIDHRDHIFVADTGNSRIVEFNPSGELVRFITVPDSPLNKPEGLYVTEKGEIYVADTGNKRVVLLDKDGNLIREFGRPDSRYIPESFKYDPINVVVDKRGFLYIATLGGYQGLLQLDPEGEFQSFHGANATAFSAIDAMKRFFYTKEMYANEISKLPGSISSLAVDNDGFIYTTTSGQGITKKQIKKLNIRGIDMLETKDAQTARGSGGFGETRAFDTRYIVGSGVRIPQLIDLTIDNNGNITAIDSTFKYINQYDASGNLLFFWAGPSTADTIQLGLMKNPIAIDSNSINDLYVLDGQENIVQVFRLSEFGLKVNQANTLTLEGRYEESEEHWQEVLRLNSNFTPAMLGLAKAAYKRGDFERAMYLFEQGGNNKGYSEAFWQLRLVWFQKNFSLFASAILLLLLFYLVAEKYTRNLKWRVKWRNRKRSEKSFIVQFKHLFYILKHPIDGFTAVRYENKGSYWSAIVVLVLAYASLVISTLYTSFSFNTVVLHRFNVIMLLLQFIAIWFGWVISNYLVSSIYKGEGRFKDVFIGSAYALIPLILVGIPLTIISNGMTDSEGAIYAFLENGMWVWVGLLFFWKIQSLQNYTVGETAINIVMSLFAFMVLAILLLVTLGLSSDLKDFIVEVYQEVRLR